ncbi:thioredoxin family protein [Paenibacillus pasadenensis]|uniref:Thioredoxin n=1 Tax=Paenibacillus pasadenensis TaxID=217090 RepID=A0A2N5NAQ6_9BACL|nr:MULTISPECIES: thioredoxin family protein [Paenibacillus]PLT47360.1 Thioredoxin [Paenibacillus pasadenensis]QGG57642.1 thioredoxin family protein [Paenibacillus sp. B01]
MARSVASKLNQGISPRQFRDGMTKNKDAFDDWYDKFEWPSEDDREFFEQLNNRDDLRVLILMAEWCGDVVRNIPVVFRALENSGVPVEVLVMEEHLDTMDEFLTMGGRSVPVVIVADTGGHVLGTWGPRPEHVQEAMRAFKRDNPDREAPDYQEKLSLTRQEMGRRYGEGTGYQAVIVRELRELLSSF